MRHQRSVVSWLLTTALLLLLAACGSSGSGDGPGGDPGGDRGDVSSPAQPVPLATAAASATFELQNVSQRTLDWTITVEHDSANPGSGDWFDIEPLSGTLAPSERQVVLLVQHEDARPGTYRSTLAVNYQGGRSLFEVVGEIDADEEWQRGDGTLRGRITLPDSLIPIDPPGGLDSSSARPLSAPAASAPAGAAHEVVVVLEPRFAALSAEEQQEQLELLSAEQGVGAARLRGPDRLIVEVEAGGDAEEIARRLSARPGVEFAEPNFRFELHALPNDPQLNRAWHLPVIGAASAWEWGPAGALPTVAIIDNGFDLDHPELREWYVSAGYDFCGDPDCNPDPDAGPDNSFLDSHGTHVAGLVAATAGNGLGSAGVIPSGARIVPVKALSGDWTTATAIADAIRWAAGGDVAGVPRNRFPAQIITLSLGATGDSRLVREAVEFAQGRGALLIASAGNSGQGSVDYPARYEQVMGVGSINSSFERSCFSDYGPGLDIMAPGGDGAICPGPDEALVSTVPGGGTGNDRGTSMAAPLVAGAAALVWANMSDPGNEQVRRQLERSAWFDPSYMSEERYGNGVLRVDRALGLPGPGDTATVQAVGPSTDIATVTFDLLGTSSQFELTDLAAGAYEVNVVAAGRSRSLEAQTQVTLTAGQVRQLTVELGR